MMIDLTTPEIKFGNGNFSVNSSGHLTAKGGGSIAGWNIGNSTLSASGITINANGNISGDGAGGGSWSIDRGHATFNSATVTGTITTGNLTATGGTIGGWNISGTTLSAGSTTLSNNGTITCNNLYANNSGQIGGWSISSGGLTGSGITLGTGQISGTGFTLNSGGLALDSGSTSVGGKNISTYVGDIVANKVTANYITAKIANVDLGHIRSVSTDLLTIHSQNFTKGMTINLYGGTGDNIEYTGQAVVLGYTI
jgi:hypothetical protein